MFYSSHPSRVSTVLFFLYPAFPLARRRMQGLLQPRWFSIDVWGDWARKAGVNWLQLCLGRTGEGAMTGALVWPQIPHWPKEEASYWGNRRSVCIRVYAQVSVSQRIRKKSSGWRLRLGVKKSQGHRGNHETELATWLRWKFLQARGDKCASNLKEAN